MHHLSWTARVSSGQLVRQFYFILLYVHNHFAISRYLLVGKYFIVAGKFLKNTAKSTSENELMSPDYILFFVSFHY